MNSKPLRIRVGQFVPLPFTCHFERLEGTRFIEMDKRVELLWQTGFKVMTPALRFRAVNNPDGALQPARAKQFGSGIGFAQVEPESRHFSRVKKSFVTFRQAWPDAPALRKTAPVP